MFLNILPTLSSIFRYKDLIMAINRIIFSKQKTDAKINIDKRKENKY